MTTKDTPVTTGMLNDYSLPILTRRDVNDLEHEYGLMSHLLKAIKKLPDDSIVTICTVLKWIANRSRGSALERSSKSITKENILQVEYYVTGWLKLVPRDWSMIISKAKSEALKQDPEYPEFVRLKAKFEPHR